MENYFPILSPEYYPRHDEHDEFLFALSVAGENTHFSRVVSKNKKNHLERRRRNVIIKAK